jgi:hypothetical protein
MRHINQNTGSTVKDEGPERLLPVVLRADMLREINAGEIFDMVFCTADRRKGTGGEIIEVKAWMKVSGEQIVTDGKIRHKTINKLAKNPNHYSNKTINIRDSRNPNRVRKVHVRLIGFYQGKRVVQ